MRFTRNKIFELDWLEILCSFVVAAVAKVATTFMSKSKIKGRVKEADWKF